MRYLLHVDYKIISGDKVQFLIELNYAVYDMVYYSKWNMIAIISW